MVNRVHCFLGCITHNANLCTFRGTKHHTSNSREHTSQLPIKQPRNRRTKSVSATTSSWTKSATDYSSRCRAASGSMLFNHNVVHSKMPRHVPKLPNNITCKNKEKKVNNSSEDETQNQTYDKAYAQRKYANHNNSLLRSYSPISCCPLL
jgi:hypothetical protein